MSNSSPDLQFGPFRLSFCPRRLARDGSEVPLTPKALDTLAFLVSRPGEVIEKQELMKTVWGDVFVDESTLTQNIFTIRKALGESAYIETVPRRGYRFIAPVREIEDGEGAERKPAPANSRRVFQTAVTGIIAVAMIVGWLVWRGGSTRRPVRSLVVLPFVNLSADPGREYFTDGLTEEIINALATMPDLRVVARTSAFQFKGKASDIRAIGAKLGVDAVLEGSVRMDGDQLRVTAQFNDARNGFHYWSHAWDHAAKDVFEVQEQIAHEVAEVLNRKSGASIPAVKPLTRSLEAYDLYLLGRYHQARLVGKSMDRAIVSFEQAIEKDPNFAAAYAGLAFCYTELGYSGQLLPSEAFPKAVIPLSRALSLDDSLAEAHALQGIISLLFDWDWERARSEFDRAISLNPDSSLAHHWYSHYLVAMGSLPEALTHANRALELDYLSLDGHRNSSLP